MAKLQNTLNLPLEKITTEELKNYLLSQICNSNISATLINQNISAFKIVQEDVLGRPWDAFKIRRPRVEKKLPNVLTVQEVEKILSSIENFKHRTMLMLLYSSGLRAQELLSLKPEHILSSTMRVFVNKGKGKKDRLTLLSQKALEQLRLYYKVYRPKTVLFESGMRRGNALSKSSLEEIIKKAVFRSGVIKKVKSHTFRHSFATHLLEQGVNIRLIQQFMGHSSIKTTSVYLHLVNSDNKNLRSPLDGMNL